MCMCLCNSNVQHSWVGQFVSGAGAKIHHCTGPMVILGQRVRQPNGRLGIPMPMMVLLSKIFTSAAGLRNQIPVKNDEMTIIAVIWDQVIWDQIIWDQIIWEQYEPPTFCWHRSPNSLIRALIKFDYDGIDRVDQEI